MPAGATGRPASAHFRRVNPAAALLSGGLIVDASLSLGQAPEGGWYACVPLISAGYLPGKGMDERLFGLNVAEIGAIAGGIELIIARWAGLERAGRSRHEPPHARSRIRPKSESKRGRQSRSISQ